MKISLILSNRTVRFLLLIVLFASTTNIIHAQAESFGTSGWGSSVNEVGPDTETCGPNRSVGRIVLAEYNSQTQLSGGTGNWIVQINNRSGVQILPTIVVAAGETNSPLFCYDTADDAVRITVLDSGSYHGYYGANAGLITSNYNEEFEGMSFVHYVHMRERANPHDLVPDYPLNGAFLRGNPTYRANLYNSTGIKTIVNLVQRLSDGATVHSRPFSTTGGAGIRTLGTTSLPDGWYAWYFISVLNGIYTLPITRATIGDYPISSLTDPVSFLIDSTRPTTAVDYAVSSTTTDSVSISIRNTLRDSTSGLASTRLHLNRIDPLTGTSSVNITIPFRPTNETTVTISATLDAGSSYNLFAVTTDAAGNIATSSVSTIVTPSPAPTPLPDLISRNLITNPSPSTIGIPINISAAVENASDVAVGISFRNLIYSSVDGVNWNSIREILHTGLAPRASITDLATTTPNQIGNLYFRHCIDSINTIAESVEAPNCTEIGPIVVNPAPIIASGCDIAVGSSTCDGTFSWNITGAANPNLYNSSTTEIYTNTAVGTNQRYPITFGNNTVVARSGINTLNFSTIQVVAECPLPSNWNFSSQVCEAPLIPPIVPPVVPPPAAAPIANMLLSSNLIASGRTTEITINIQSTEDMNCTLRGATTTEITFTHQGSLLGAVNERYTYTTRPLYNAQILRLDCVGATTNFSRNTRVNVVGIMQEV
jgi:hypothetical protein